VIDLIESYVGLESLYIASHNPKPVVMNVSKILDGTSPKIVDDYT
jgi:hypothetical protein